MRLSISRLTLRLAPAYGGAPGYWDHNDADEDGIACLLPVLHPALMARETSSTKSLVLDSSSQSRLA